MLITVPGNPPSRSEDAVGNTVFPEQPELIAGMVHVPETVPLNPLGAGMFDDIPLILPPVNVMSHPLPDVASIWKKSAAEQSPL